jgi:hypothetical protein
MVELVELNSNKHQGLKIRAASQIEYAGGQQIMKLRVAEVAKAVANFPVFFTREQQYGGWVLSALTSFEAQHNLFVKDGQWQSTYQPSSMQTHPLYLIQSAQQQQSYSLGILEQSSAFSQDQGHDIFEKNGQPSIYLRRLQKLLEADIKHDINTHQFCLKLQELELLKAVDLVIQYEDDRIQTVAGLHSLHEDKLQALTDQQMLELNKLGYLIPIHAMLISIYQLNLLVRKNNELPTLDKVKQLKIEVAKDKSAG